MLDSGVMSFPSAIHRLVENMSRSTKTKRPNLLERSPRHSR